MEEIVKQLLTPGKGILAADESFPTIEKRFAKINLESTSETRRTYRELLFSTPDLEKYISGMIMFDETIRQQIPVNNQIVRGIKVDLGKVGFQGHSGEKVTQGLEGLGGRLKEYTKYGAKFSKWRAVFSITATTPSIECIEENADRLAKFAKISQDEGLVPIVEPEVLMDGNHSIEKCAEVTRVVLKFVFLKLEQSGVLISNTLLKPNMVLPGKDCLNKSTPVEIAQRTLGVLKEAIPLKVPGVVFLSGGQTPDEATENLRQINKLGGVPWQLSFSFGRALQEPALAAWKGKKENIKKAQKSLLTRAKMNSEARYGR
ncbi:class I fructose-bisphosphate aldolase [Patescibacteria group bacterium]